MASFIPNLTTWPFPPGESPFTIKGTAYRGHLEYVEKHVPGGVAAMCKGLPESYAAYFAQPFLASSLYDIVPLIVAAQPCAVLMNMSPYDFASIRARDQAPKDLDGVYRFLLSMVPTGSVARRLPQLVTQVFSFGKTTITEESPGSLSGALEGLPEALAPWMSAIVSAYAEAALRTSGAKEASFVVKPGELAGTAHGVRLVRCPIELRYS